MYKTVIEIVGLPGTGKTTWSKSQDCRSIHTRDFSRSSRYRNSGLYIVRHPMIFFLLLIMTLKHMEGIRQFKHRILFLLLGSLAKERVAFGSGGRVIIDEGIFQYILASFKREISSTDRKVILYIVSRLPQRTLIWFTCDKKERSQRMAERRRVPRAGFGHEYQKRWLKTLELNADEYLSILQASGFSVEIKDTTESN